MLDNPEKTARLFTALKASVPFEATLSPDLTSLLARQQKPVLVRPVETVSDVSPLGALAYQKHRAQKLSNRRHMV